MSLNLGESGKGALACGAAQVICLSGCICSDGFITVKMLIVSGLLISA